MSVEDVIVDVATGDFSDAERRLGQWWSGLGPELKAFVTTMATAQGQILQGLVVTAAKDVLTGGLTTASFTAAAADVQTKLVAQEISIGTQTVFAALNAAVAANVPVAAPAAA